MIYSYCKRCNLESPGDTCTGCGKRAAVSAQMDQWSIAINPLMDGRVWRAALIALCSAALLLMAVVFGMEAAVNGGEAATGYIGLTYEETWEFHTDYLCRYELDTTRWRVYERTTEYPNYWCWANAASTDMTLVDYTQISGDRIVEFPLHSFPRTSGRNHKKYSIKVNAVTLPAATYRYLKNLQDITQGSGSLFSPNPGEMASNIICESNPDLSVLGYVTTSLSTSKRAFLDSRYYTPLMPPTNYLFISENFKEDYEYGYYPVDLMILPRGENGEDVEGVYWGPLRCIDCIEAGGTKEKPDFWE